MMFDAFIHLTRKWLWNDTPPARTANVAMLYQVARAADTNDGGEPMFLCVVQGTRLLHPDGASGICLTDYVAHSKDPWSIHIRETCWTPWAQPLTIPV